MPNSIHWAGHEPSGYDPLYAPEGLGPRALVVSLIYQDSSIQGNPFGSLSHSLRLSPWELAPLVQSWVKYTSDTFTVPWYHCGKVVRALV